MNSNPAFPSLFQYVCRVTVYKIRANLTGFSGVVIRLGRFDSRTRDSVTTANPYVATIASSDGMAAIEEMDPARCGRFVTLEKPGSPLEFEEIYVNGCGLGNC